MVREQREKIQIGPTGDKKFEDEDGWECSISRRRDRLYSGGIRVGGARGESHSVTSGDSAGGAAPRVRAANNSEFGEGEL